MAVVLGIAAAAAAQNAARVGTISGRLSLRNGMPAAGRRVLALAVEEAPGNRNRVLTSLTETDATGRYLLENLPPGRYTVATGSLEELTFFPGTATESQATVVTVTNGARIGNVDFRLATVRVSGRLVGDTAAIVALHGRGAAPALSITELRLGPGSADPRADVGPDGSFQFGAVRPGTYRPTLGATPVGILSNAAVVVGDDDVADLQFRVARVMSFPVAITVEGGGQAPSFQLRFEAARAGDSAAAVVEVVATASFEMGLPDIQYRLVLPETPPGFFLKAATLVYPSGGTTSILEKPFITHQVASLEIVLARAGASK
jgi:hypothetical protein